MRLGHGARKPQAGGVSLLSAPHEGSFRRGLPHSHVASGGSTVHRGLGRGQSALPPLGAGAGGEPVARRSEGQFVLMGYSKETSRCFFEWRVHSWLAQAGTGCRALLRQIPHDGWGDNGSRGSQEREGDLFFRDQETKLGCSEWVVLPTFQPQIPGGQPPGT